MPKPRAGCLRDDAFEASIGEYLKMLHEKDYAGFISFFITIKTALDDHWKRMMQ